jgi:predicted ATPase
MAMSGARDPIGTSLSHYRISARLGAGGMGEVYRATDTKLGRDVALKILPAEMAESPERLERFQREARALAALDHPGIVTVYSVEEADGVHFLTMQLVEGQPLDQLIPEGGMPLERLVEIGAGLTDALAAAHDKGIVHRDLKPANVMVTKDGRVKVLDFGLAKVAAASEGEARGSQLETEMKTREGVVMGTVPYMSPEQVAGRPVDHRTDVFSLGVILYEMSSGRRPFEGGSSAELASAILRDAPRPLRELRADLPDALAGIAQRCLVKEAGGRPQRVHAVRDVLCALSSGKGSGRLPIPAPIAREERVLGNLPSAVDSFVAREGELAEVVARLEDARLLTLVGAGGTGKTRLATEAAGRLAARFAGGAWLVELAPVMQAEAVPHVVADLIGAVPLPGKTVVQSVVESLRHRSLLLVLDNCEHVLDAAAELASAVIAHCAGVRILATSRESLAIRGEQAIRLQSLSDADGAILFRDRARAAGARGERGMPTLARLSRRLDGMPLAIELAAARCDALSPEQIEQRLDDRFRLLRGSRRGRVERHQTLHNTVAWSYELLAPLERQVFDRLSVFAGGFTLEAARAVAGGDDIDGVGVEEAVSALVARSMVLAGDTGDGTRYRLLETLRQFAGERLVQSGSAARVRDYHLRYFVGFMREAWVGLWSAGEAQWIRAVGREFENLRVAVYAAIDSGERSAIEALIRPHVWWAWQSLRYEVGDWAEAALGVDPEPACVRAVAIHLLMHGGRPDHVALLAGKLGRPEDARDPDAAWITALGHCDAAIVSGSPEASRWIRLSAEIAQRAGSPAQAATLKSLQVVFKVMAGEMDEGRRIAEEAHREAEATGNQVALCWTTFFMGRAHSDADPTLALEYFDRSAAIAERIRIPLLVGIAATEAAVVIARFEEPSRARPRLARALRSFVDSGDLRQLWTSAHHLAYFLLRAGRPDDARSIWRELGARQAFAAQHHRDELKQLLGEPGPGVLSDDELIARIRSELDALEDDGDVQPVDRPQGTLP